MRTAAIIFCIIWLSISLAWAITNPGGFEPYISILGAIIALISSLFLKKSDPGSGQNQTVSDKSLGIQAGRDVKIKNLDKK